MFYFGAQLKELRKALGITQKQLAKELGASERGIQQYELGERKPTYDMLIALADYFDVPVDYLLGRGVFQNWDAIVEHKEDLSAVLSTIHPALFAHLVEPWDEIQMIRLLPLLFQKIEFNGPDILLSPTISVKELMALRLPKSEK